MNLYQNTHPVFTFSHIHEFNPMIYSHGSHEAFPLPMTVPALRVAAPACGPKRSAPRWHPKAPWSWPCHKRLPGCFLGPGGLGRAWEIYGNLWEMAHLRLKKIWKILEILDDWDMRLNIDIPWYSPDDSLPPYFCWGIWEYQQFDLSLFSFGDTYAHDFVGRQLTNCPRISIPDTMWGMCSSRRFNEYPKVTGWWFHIIPHALLKFEMIIQND